jgi:hypothetical protein
MHSLVQIFFIFTIIKHNGEMMMQSADIFNICFRKNKNSKWKAKDPKCLLRYIKLLLPSLLSIIVVKYF